MNKLLPSCFLVAGLVFTGCEKKTPKAGDGSSTSSANPLTAPVIYLGVKVKAKKMADKPFNSAGITQAIGMFQAEKGRNPKSLNELVPDYLPQVPTPPPGMKFDYNAGTG